jgi:hypothetical protein
MTMTSLPRLSLVVVSANGTESRHDLRVSECQGKFEASILGTKSQVIKLRAGFGPTGKRIEATILLSVQSGDLCHIIANDADYELVIKPKEAQ